MAVKDVRVDLDLKQNELLNFAIHNVDSRTSIENPVDGQMVHESNGKIYVYHLIDDQTMEGVWEEIVNKDVLDSAVQDLGDKKLDKINSANKVYGTNENGDQTSYDVDSFGKVDDVKIGNTSAVVNKIATLGTMAGEDKNDYVVTEIDNGANGKAYVWNETSGGGVRYEKGSDKVFVGVNGGNSAGEFVSIYAKNGVDADTKRIIVKSDGAYYLKNNGIETTGNDEIATKGDVLAKDSLPARTPQTAGQFLTNDGADASWEDLPEYTIVKDAQAEQGYAHTYHLTKDGVNVGASINIPKDIVVESGSVKTCTQDDDPVQGYKVGDKYIDLLLANSGGSHLYILVNDLIDVYTGSTYIDITDNTISLKYADLKTQLTTDLQNTFYTETEVDGLLNDKADKATTLSGYGITDAYTKTEVDNIAATKTDKELSSANGTAKIFNEVDGGGVQYDSALATGDTVFVGVHGDNQVGEFVSIYAKDKSDSTQTKRVIVKTDGAYYLKNNGIETTGNDEIATKGDITSAISNTKQVELCPALTASGGQFTWTFNNSVGEDATVTIREVGGTNNDILANVVVTSQTITIKMNQTADLQSVTAGQFKAIVLG